VFKIDMWHFFILLILFIPLAVADKPSIPTETITIDRQQELRNMLEHDCGACHGLSLKGGLGSALTPEALAGKPDDFLVTTILEGRKGTAMPPWKTFLKESEARWLVQQLRELKKENDINE
jgi:cytochrome c55X